VLTEPDGRGRVSDRRRMSGAVSVSEPTDPTWTMHPSRCRVARAVGKRLVPALIEATLIPTAVFYLLLASTGELMWAIVGVLIWSYTAAVRRILTGRQIPTLLLLVCLGVTVKTLIFLFSGNTFVYFAQPILGTTVTAAVFGASVLVGRPLIGRFAEDFCPLTDEVRARPAISQLFCRLTLLWAAINFSSAAVSLVLLVTVPVPVFVGARTATAWLLTFAGVIVTVWESVRVARGEGLATAVGPNGTLHAYVAPPLLVAA
jgi:Protein of unknown function (DUF3159)